MADTITYKECAELLKTNQYTLDPLIDLGYLNYIDEHNRILKRSDAEALVGIDTSALIGLKGALNMDIEKERLARNKNN